jgi:hypothetical protein
MGATHSSGTWVLTRSIRPHNPEDDSLHLSSSLDYGSVCGMKVMVCEITLCAIDFFLFRKWSDNEELFYLLLAAEN